MIEPRTLRGFRDYPPALMIPRERVLQTAREVYRSYGFAPIDTPAMEYAEVLLGKGGEESDRIVYRFKDHGDRDVALRFDLTVPFARFAAQHINTLGTPFKRYAMGPVWRGENTSAGRYREFWQCDFDTIGTTSNAADIETVLVINDLFTALTCGDFQIRVNHRRVLNGILNSLAFTQRPTDMMRSIDKKEKIGEENLRREIIPIAQTNNTAIWNGIKPIFSSPGVFSSYNMVQLENAFSGFAIFAPKLATEAIEYRYAMQSEEAAIHSFEKSIFESLPQEQFNNLLEAFNTKGDNKERLNYIDAKFGDEINVKEGLKSLRQLLECANAIGIPEGRLRIDLSIARGLDYYTGTIFETFLTDLPGIGSVCSGGRYDNLASLYTKQVLPGVGASLGVDRLLAAMEELKHPWLSGVSTPAPVLVLNLDANRLGEYQALAQSLRKAGIGTEVYPEAKKLGAQFQYAEKRGHQLAVIAGEAEFATSSCKVKILSSRKEFLSPLDELSKTTKRLLSEIGT